LAYLGNTYPWLASWLNASSRTGGLLITATADALPVVGGIQVDGQAAEALRRFAHYGIAMTFKIDSESVAHVKSFHEAFPFINVAFPSDDELSEMVDSLDCFGRLPAAF
jgi:hypothetical protein